MTARAILVSVRFTPAEIEQLKARGLFGFRKRDGRGTRTGARRTCRRRFQGHRRTTGPDGTSVGGSGATGSRDKAAGRTLTNERGIKDLLAMFDELLKTLTRGSAA